MSVLSQHFHELCVVGCSSSTGMGFKKIFRVDLQAIAHIHAQQTGRGRLSGRYMTLPGAIVCPSMRTTSRLSAKPILCGWTAPKRFHKVLAECQDIGVVARLQVAALGASGMGGSTSAARLAVGRGYVVTPVSYYPS